MRRQGEEQQEQKKQSQRAQEKETPTSARPSSQAGAPAAHVGAKAAPPPSSQAGALAGASPSPPAQSFLEWARENTVVKSSAAGGELQYEPKRRGGHGAGKHKEKCALGVHFPYEMLDIFIGAWCAMMVPHNAESEFAPRQGDDAAPVGAQYLDAALRHPYYNGDVEKLLDEIGADMLLRGLSEERRHTFGCRVRAFKLLLDNTGSKGLQIPAHIWDVRRLDRLPPRVWSEDQATVVDLVSRGVAVDDANVARNEAGLEVHPRMLLLTGKPGAGKTETVIGCAAAAAAKGERVLIACPIGALVDTYRQKLPPNENICIETVHASHRITRAADEQYIPPGRLRTFDLIVYDEVSQLEDDVWTKVRSALRELRPHPFVMFVGDFKQLQPVQGDPLLQTQMAEAVRNGRLRHIDLRMHEHARSKDPELLDFLHLVRQQQPQKQLVQAFFGNRRLARDCNMRRGRHVFEAVETMKRVEATSGRTLTCLTVTNAGALKINHTRCRMDFDGHEAVTNSAAHRVPGDPEYGGGDVVLIPGMRVRLTRNIDKERGFVNGALGEVEFVLRKDVVVVKTPLGVRHLVFPVTFPHKGKRCKFVPVCYGYAMTIRRAQGSTLDLVALWFDHAYPCDRGYAYVGASRVRSAKDLCLVGKVRRTDWLPVGGDDTDEQTQRGSESEDSRPCSDEPSSDEAPSGSSDECSEDLEDQALRNESAESSCGSERDRYPDTDEAASLAADDDDASDADLGWDQENAMVQHP